MPHPIFRIDELLRLDIGELVKTNRPSAVSLTLACRSLEEPTLSSLWKEQSSFLHLIAVLPAAIWVEGNDGDDVVVSGQALCALGPVTISPGNRGRLISGGLGKITTIRLLDAWVTPRRQGGLAPIQFSGSRVVHPMGFCFPS